MGTNKLLAKPNKLQGSDLRWSIIPSRGSRNTPSNFMLQKLGYARSTAMGTAMSQLASLLSMIEILWFVFFLRASQMKCTELAERNLPTLQSNIDSMYAMLVHEFKNMTLW